MSEGTPWLHIRSQSHWHSEAEIRATRAGLLSLRNAIDAALDSGKGNAQAFASDGEGYAIAVVRCRTVSSLGSPFYLDDAAYKLVAYERSVFIKHDKLIRAQNEEALEALRWCRANGSPHVPPHAATTPAERD